MTIKTGDQCSVQYFYILYIYITAHKGNKCTERAKGRTTTVKSIINVIYTKTIRMAGVFDIELHDVDETVEIDSDDDVIEIEEVKYIKNKRIH